MIYFNHTQEKEALQKYNELCKSSIYPDIYLIDSWNPESPGLWIEFELYLRIGEELISEFHLSEEREKTINQIFE